MRKKRIISCMMLLVVFCCIFTGCTSKEIPIPQIEKNVYIYDEDNVINDDVEKNLNKMLIDLEKKTGTEFAVISVKSLLNISIESYANNLFNTLGIGKKDQDNGILLLFSRSDNKVRLEIGRGLESCLNDSKCGRILDQYFVPYREDDEYSKATEMTVKAILTVIAKEYDIDIQGIEGDFPIENNSDNLPLWGWIIIFIVLVIAIAVIFSDDDGPSGGRFYGSSSHGSSGGRFGGGFSGGGGASR